MRNIYLVHKEPFIVGYSLQKSVPFQERVTTCEQLQLFRGARTSPTAPVPPFLAPRPPGISSTRPQSSSQAQRTGPAEQSSPFPLPGDAQRLCLSLTVRRAAQARRPRERGVGPTRARFLSALDRVSSHKRFGRFSGTQPACEMQAGPERGSSDGTQGAHRSEGPLWRAGGWVLSTESEKPPGDPHHLPFFPGASSAAVFCNTPRTQG